MADLMSYDQWMLLTDGGTFSTRSKQLKWVDQALKAYHEANENSTGLASAKKDLIMRFTGWQALKKDWKTSKRNKKGGVTALNRQINALQGIVVKMSKSEQDALDFMQKAHEETMRLLFKTAVIQFKGTGKLDKASLGVGIQSITSNCVKLEKAGSKSKSVAKVSNFRTAFDQQIQKIFTEICGGKVAASEIGRAMGAGFEVLMNESLQKAAAAITPFVGTITSGGTAIYSFCMAAYKAYEKSDIHTHSLVLKEGSPKEACAALERIFQREVNSNVAAGLVSASSMTAKLTGTLVDLGAASGPAIGLAESIANFVQLLYLIVRDYREMKKAKAYIALKVSQKKRIESDLFTEAPLLGAYYIVSANDSDLLSFMTMAFGSKDWNVAVEVIIKKHVRPLQNKAKTLIKDSRIEVTGIANKEVVKQTKEQKKTIMADKDVRIRGLGTGNMYS